MCIAVILTLFCQIHLFAYEFAQIPEDLYVQHQDTISVEIFAERGSNF